MASRAQLSLALTAVLLAGAAFAQGRSTFCCNDARGVPVCGDILPQACYGRAYREMNERGVTVRRVDAPLTKEQLAEREAQARRKQEEDRVRHEQERRDQALLASYTSAEDIDYLRDKALSDVEASMQRAQQRYDEAIERRKQLNAEMEFYRKSAPPKSLTDAISETDAILRAQTGLIEAKQRDKQAIRAKYDEEKRRYLELRRPRTR